MLRPYAGLESLSLKTTAWIFSVRAGRQLPYIHSFSEPNVRLIRPLLLVVILLSSALAGCLKSTDNQHNISLTVNYDQTNGTIVHSYVDGEFESATNIAFSFDFSNAEADNELVWFGIDVFETEETFTIDAKMFEVATGAASKTKNATYTGAVDGLITEIEILAWEMMGV